MYNQINNLEPSVIIPVREYERLKGLENTTIQKPPVTSNQDKNYEYGIKGIQSIFNCCYATAHKIKSSGKIDKAITQVGRKIVIDKDLALSLAGQKNGGRR